MEQKTRASQHREKKGRGPWKGTTAGRRKKSRRGGRQWKNQTFPLWPTRKKEMVSREGRKENKHLDKQSTRGGRPAVRGGTGKEQYQTHLLQGARGLFRPGGRRENDVGQDWGKRHDQHLTEETRLLWPGGGGGRNRFQGEKAFPRLGLSKGGGKKRKKKVKEEET